MKKQNYNHRLHHLSKPTLQSNPTNPPLFSRRRKRPPRRSASIPRSNPSFAIPSPSPRAHGKQPVQLCARVANFRARKRRRIKAAEARHRCNRSVPLQVAVVARRRSEGTHPINKTTRVTIEFNRRERTGSRRRSWTAAASVHGGRRGAGGWKGVQARSKSPSTYPPLLFIVPNFHSLRTRRAVLRAVGSRSRKEKNRSRERPHRRWNSFCSPG